MFVISCENCGKSEYVVEDGVVNCLNCGSKFACGDIVGWVHESVLQETKLLIEETYSSSDDDYVAKLARAKAALDASNLVAFNDCCDQLISTHEGQSLVWLLKGEAVGWNTTIWTPKNLDYAVSYMLKAIALAQPEELTEISRISQEVIELLWYAFKLQMLEQLVQEPSINRVSEYYDKDLSILRKRVSLAIAARSKTMNELNAAPDEDEDDETYSLLDYILMDSSTQAALCIWNTNLERYENAEGAFDLTRFWNCAYNERRDAKETDYDKIEIAHWIDVAVAACLLLEWPADITDIESASIGRLVLSANASALASDLYAHLDEIQGTCPWDNLRSVYSEKHDKKVAELKSRVEDIRAEVAWRTEQKLSELSDNDD